LPPGGQPPQPTRRSPMRYNVIYIVGIIAIILAILAFLF
jgi:hypothetical protein